jgi:tetratricopeptide (TPR) repeat protein
MNTKIYKAVHNLAELLMEAADRNNQQAFDALYAELKSICEKNNNTDKDHPVQWETLADFTEELDDAIEIYKIALKKSADIDSKDHMSSIAFSMAMMQVELGHKDAAIKSLQDAKVSANKIEDKELKSEIHDLLESLLTS